MVHWQEPRIYETAWRIFVKTGFSMSAPNAIHWNFIGIQIDLLGLQPIIYVKQIDFSKLEDFTV